MMGFVDMRNSALVSVLGLVVAVSANAVELRGDAAVNITSDTATNAKNIAFDEARRQIITDTLRQYADVGALKTAVQKTKGADLLDLIAASSIDGEQTSDTTYSANISMVVNVDAARNWLTENGVQNWLPDGSVRDVFTVNVKMSNPLADWAGLNKIARAEQIDLATTSMTMDTAVLEIPTGMRGRFTIALREGGWRYANQDGSLRIWK